MPFRASLDIRATFPRTFSPHFFNIPLAIYSKIQGNKSSWVLSSEIRSAILRCDRSCAFFHKTRRTPYKNRSIEFAWSLLPSNFKISWTASAKRKAAKDMNAGPKTVRLLVHVCERAFANKKNENSALLFARCSLRPLQMTRPSLYGRLGTAQRAI